MRYGVTMAFDPAFARFGPGWEAILLRLETAAGEGITRFEFLGAAMPHKQRFTDRFEPIYQGIGLARTLRGRAAVEALVGGIRVRRAIKRSETARKLYYRVAPGARLRPMVSLDPRRNPSLQPAQRRDVARRLLKPVVRRRRNPGQ